VKGLIKEKDKIERDQISWLKKGLSQGETVY
jgi:hypothetical protein